MKAEAGGSCFFVTRRGVKSPAAGASSFFAAKVGRVSFCGSFWGVATGPRVKFTATGVRLDENLVGGRMEPDVLSSFSVRPGVRGGKRCFFTAGCSNSVLRFASIAAVRDGLPGIFAKTGAGAASCDLTSSCAATPSSSSTSS